MDSVTKNPRSITLQQARGTIEKFEKQLKKCKNVKKFQRFVKICTSMGLMFIQYNLLHDALWVLKRAEIADKRLQEFLRSPWRGRVIFFNAAAFLMLKIGDLSTALKFLFDAQTTMCDNNDENMRISVELQIQCNLLTFMLLWKINKLQDAKTYIEISCELITVLLKKQGRSLVSKMGRVNLFGLINMSLAALRIAVDGNFESAYLICENSLLKIKETDAKVIDLIEQFLRLLRQGRINSNDLKLTLPRTGEAQSQYRIPDLQDIQIKQLRDDWLITPKYIEIVYSAILAPYIGQNIPTIGISEDEMAFAQNKQYIRIANQSASNIRSPPKIHTSPNRNMSSNTRGHYRNLTPQKQNASLSTPSSDNSRKSPFAQRGNISGHVASLRRKVNPRAINVQFFAL